MADTPLPPSQAFPPAGEPVLPSSEGVQPGLNGVPAPTHVTPAPAERRPAAPTFREWVVYRLTQLGVLVGLCLLLYFVLYNFWSLKPANALGFSIILSLIASFFLRSLVPLPSPAEKAQAAGPQTGSPPVTDSAREIVETVVFVVVLVLMLKSFVAEAFVIPTGSMAETLYGYQKLVVCPQCKIEFPVNCSAEVDPSDDRPSYVSGCTCPNCRRQIRFGNPQPGNDEQPFDVIHDPSWNSGDRVLVSKFVYDLPGKLPGRLDVVVFKFPGDEGFPSRSGPVKKHSPMNYIKRLIGLPGETIAIHLGKLYVLPPEKHPPKKYKDFEDAKGDPDKLSQLWRPGNMHSEDPDMVKLFNEGAFEIIRKPPAVILSMMRLVYDNDHQARDLENRPEYQRWQRREDSQWSATGKTAFRHASTGSKVDWLRYQHILRDSGGKPQLITDFMGYNTWRSDIHKEPPDENWASDLIVEGNVQVHAAEGVFALGLSKGRDHFQAHFDLDKGTCTLLRQTGKEKPVELKREDGEAAVARAELKKGSYSVRFANVDHRLIVWVDGRLLFGDGVTYSVPKEQKLVPIKENDLERPVSIGAGADITVSNLKVYRDTYYTTGRSGSGPSRKDVDFTPQDPDSWKSFEGAPVNTFYVQPGHFLCLGDNSPESSDGRTWGLVPKRLLLGKALLVYYPFARAGRIR